MSFESAATAERRPLSVTERAETRRHGEGTARSRRSNQSQITGRSPIDVSEDITVARNTSDNFYDNARYTSTGYAILGTKCTTYPNVSMNFRCRLIASAQCEDYRATSYVTRRELRFRYGEAVGYPQ